MTSRVSGRSVSCLEYTFALPVRVSCGLSQAPFGLVIDVIHGTL